MTISTIIKMAIGAAARRSGYLLWREKFRPRKGVLVLFGHRVVSSSDRPFFQDSIELNRLEKYLRYLLARYRFVSLDEACDILDNGDDVSNAVALTFDDGFRDNLTLLSPLLDRLRIPATIFVSTALTDNQTPPWTYRLRHAIAMTNISEIEVAGKQLRLATAKMRLSALGHLLPILKKRDQTETLEVVDDICHKLMVQSPSDVMLSWDDIRELLKNPLISIGSHCVSHRILTLIDPADARQELATSKARLEKELGVEIGHLVYPNGDFDTEVLSAAKSVGYRAGWVTHGRSDAADPINKSDSNRFRLTRIALEPVPTSVLASEMAGLYVAMRWNKHQNLEV